MTFVSRCSEFVSRCSEFVYQLAWPFTIVYNGLHAAIVALHAVIVALHAVIVELVYLLLKSLLFTSAQQVKYARGARLNIIA